MNRPTFKRLIHAAFDTESSDDFGRRHLHQIITPQLVIQIGSGVVHDLDTKVAHSIKKPNLRHGIYPSEDVNTYLDTCKDLVVADITMQSSAFTPAQWLWYLRRLPDCVFSGETPKVLPYYEVLAECLTATSTLNDVETDRGDLSFLLNMENIQHVVEYCVAIVYLAHVDALQRIARKSIDFTFSGRALPRHIPTREQEQALRIYEERAVRENLHNIYTGTPSTQAGTVVADYLAWPESQENKDCLLHVLRREPRIVAPNTPRTARCLPQDIRYSIPGVSYEKLGLLNSDGRLNGVGWWQPEAAPLMALLNSMWRLLPMVPEVTEHIMKFGYVAMPTHSFASLIDRVLPESVTLVERLLPGSIVQRKATRLVNELRKLEGSLWPMPASPVIRRSKNMLYIDFYAATYQLRRALEFPRTGGEIANARSGHFEFQTQAVINSSPWRPSPELLEIRGRQLKNSSGIITDIDAIGSNGENLLIVDCKSVIACRYYASGDYGIVRNTASNISEWVTKWTGKREAFLATPKGNNYDFSKYKNIIAVVCTPSAMFVDLATASLNASAGLPAAASLSELANWLRQPAQGS